MRTSPWLSQPTITRFRSHVLATETCAIWLGAIGSDGYGRFSVRSAQIQRIVSPHLVAATLAFGPVPVGSTLMHDCDVRICVATGPGHVRVATQGENMQQAARRGRAAGPRPGLVDVRGNVGAARASRRRYATRYARRRPSWLNCWPVVLAAGSPLRGIEGLFDPPLCAAPRPPAVPARPTRARGPGDAAPMQPANGSVPLFNLTA